MARQANQNLKRALWILLAVLAITPLQLLNLLDAEEQKVYWCDAAHYSSARCHAAEEAVTTTLWSVVVLALALLGSLGVVFDRLILPAHQEAPAEHAG